MATVPGIMVELGANVARMQADMRQLTGVMNSGFSQIESFAKKAGGALIAYFSVEKLLEVGKQALETGDKMAKLSQSVGISVETLSVLSYAAKLSDLDLEGLAKGVGILSRNMMDTASGTGEARDAFAALGISVKDSSGNLLSSDKVMGQVSDRFAGMEDGAGKTALAMKIFGRSGAEMIPLLNQGSGALADMRAEAESLGLVLSEDMARQMERVNDNFTRMHSAAQGIAVQIMAGVSPTLENLTNILFEAEKGTGNFNVAIEATSAGLKLFASGTVIALTGLKDVGGGIGAIAAAIYTAATGDIKTAFEILKMEGQDSRELWTRAGETLAKIWDKGAEDALRAGNKIKKALAPPPLLRTDDDKNIEKRLKALAEEAEAMQMGADALDLYKKGFHGATEEQKSYALYLLRLIDAHEQEKKSLLDRVAAEEADEKQIQESEKAIYDMVDALKVQAIAAGMSEEETFKFQLVLKGASRTLIENADAYFAAIRGARDYNDQIELLKGVIEETRTPIDRYQERMREIQRLMEAGWINPEEARIAQENAWAKMITADQQGASAREQILLDFGDRVRAQNRFTADYAIEQIERQARIFKAAGADEVAVAIWAAKEKQKASREWQDGAIRGLEDYAAAATDAAKNTEQVFGSAFKTMEDNLVDFLKTGKMSFKKFIDVIIADLLRLTVRQGITGPVSRGWGSLMSGFFGGGGGAVMESPAAWGGQSAAMFHGGGIAGSSFLAGRSVPAVYLAAAPRFHSGLQPDDFPAVLKRGEGVFTPEQMKALGGKTNVSISIPVNMAGGDTRKAGRMRRDLEGELEPVVRRIVERYA